MDSLRSDVADLCNIDSAQFHTHKGHTIPLLVSDMIGILCVRQFRHDSRFAIAVCCMSRQSGALPMPRNINAASCFQPIFALGTSISSSHLAMLTNVDQLARAVGQRDRPPPPFDQSSNCPPCVSDAAARNWTWFNIAWSIGLLLATVCIPVWCWRKRAYIRSLEAQVDAIVELQPVQGRTGQR